MLPWYKKDAHEIYDFIMMFKRIFEGLSHFPKNLLELG